jgi:hypothetical protein
VDRHEDLEDAPGIEPLKKPPRKPHSRHSGVESGASVPRDPDLTLLIGAWDTLPGHIKAAIRALLAGAAGPP